MSWRIQLFLFTLGIAAILLVGTFQNAPGYMDADYYYAGGIRLAEGKGFTEEFLWNYLDNPRGLPHPSHAYWMPLASLIAALGMKVAGSTSFWAARLGLIFTAGLVPPVTSSLAYSISGQRDHAILAGLLAAFPGFYLAYIGTTDTFGIYMLLGASWMIVAEKANPIQTRRLEPMGRALALGLISGLLHLSRADGITWLAVAVIMTLVRVIRVGNSIVYFSMATRLRELLLTIIALLLGYLIVMGPWMGRNLAVFGTILSPGGLRALWFTDYNELFSYPSTLLTPQHWWSSGLDKIIEARWYSLGQNLQTALVVQGEILLTPLLLLGLWHWRRKVSVQFGLLAWSLTLVIMTIVFPFVGWRGGFLHSGAALQPLFWAVTPSGLDIIIEWGRRVRQWNTYQASRVFRVGVVGMTLLLTILIVQRRVIGSSMVDPIWGISMSAYTRLERILIDQRIEPGEIVMVNNAPGYYAANRRPALSIPNGDVETTLEVAHRYQAAYILLDHNHPEGLAKLYENPADQIGLEHLITFEGTHIFAVK